MYLVDTHAHLFLEEFDADRDDVIAGTVGRQVQKIIIPNIDEKSIEPLLKICEAYPAHCFPAMGLHPSSVNAEWEKSVEIIRHALFNGKFYAIGETGMDLYRDSSTLEWQKEAFRQQIKWALELNLPLIIHSRHAVDEIIHVLKAFTPSCKGVFHCFGGTLPQALHVVEMGFKIGIGGVVTFKNSGMAKLVEALPLESLVLETDAPYLAPVPYRGKRNESSYLPLVAEKIAEVKKCTYEEVVSVTTHNAEELFGI